MFSIRFYHIFSILLAFSSVESAAQVNFIFDQQKADSLQHLVSTSTGHASVDVLNQLAYLYIRRNAGLSDSLMNEALNRSIKLKYSKGEAYASYINGILEYTQGNSLSGYEKLYHTVGLSKKNQDTGLLVDAYYHLASLSYFSRTDIEQGVAYMNKALDLAISSRDPLRIAQAYAAMGFVAFHAGDGEKGKEMWENYFHYAERLSVNRMEKALMLASYGDCYELLGDFRKAVDIYLEALKIFNPESVEERALMAQNMAYLGERYQMTGNPDSAVYCFYSGLELARRYSHIFGSMLNCNYLAEYYYDNESYGMSKKYCDSVIYFGEKIESRGSFFDLEKYDHLLGASMEIFVPLTPDYKKYLAWTSMQKAYQTLLEIYEKGQNTDDAYFALKASLPVRDSLIRYEQKKELKEILTRYETEQKEKQILVLSQENQLPQFRIRQNSMFLAGMVGIVVLVILFALVLLRQNKIKADQQALLLKQRLFRSQMNPHFIFNSLSSIQGTIINEEPDKAVKYLSRFSKLMRNILDSSLEESVSLSEEITTIENYLELQKVRFPRKFDYVIEVDNSLPLEDIQIPPMLAQPFIENAIEHGIKNKGSKGHIYVRFKSLGHKLIYEVEDDGIGRVKALEILKKQNQDHRSFATVITQERIKVINKKSKSRIKFEIFDLENDKDGPAGTKVVFEVSYNDVPGALHLIFCV